MAKNIINEKKCSRSFGFCKDEILTTNHEGIDLGKIYPAMEETSECKECGKTHGSFFFMSTLDGTAKVNGQEYELLHSIAGNPIIISKTSKRSFTLDWKEIIKMARKRGIDGGKFANAFEKED